MVRITRARCLLWQLRSEKPQFESRVSFQTPEVINIFIRIAFFQIKRNVEKSSMVYFIIRQTLLKIFLHVARIYDQKIICAIRNDNNFVCPTTLLFNSFLNFRKRKNKLHVPRAKNYLLSELRT